MWEHRPEEFRGAGDACLLQLSRQLQEILQDTQRIFRNDSLRLRKTELAKLAEILVELAEDLHNQIGIWDAYERYNFEFFGERLPFALADPTESNLCLARVQHLLWVLYPQVKPGLIVSPHHQDLKAMARAAYTCLAEAFQTVAKGSGVKMFLQTSNRLGWDVKRKLVWLGTRSYMFRLFFNNYLAEQNRGRWEIGYVDDFLCQECTRWSGLGAADILAGTLNISEKDRQELRSWYERHTSFYRLRALTDEYIDALNVISDQPYRIRLDMPDHPFKCGQLIFGSLVPWRGDWYWSGRQEAWDSSADIDVGDLRNNMKRKSSQILCRFWKEYEGQVRQRAEQLHNAALDYHGMDLAVYSDGLVMAADWQKELRVAWDSKPREHIEKAVRKYGLKKGRPDLDVPQDLLEHKQGIGVFLNPEEGKEIMCGFDALVEGLSLAGCSFTDEQEEAIQQFINSPSISPEFLRRVVTEYGSESIRAAFRLPKDAPKYWLEYLLRSRKGHFFRKRYPTVSVV